MNVTFAVLASSFLLAGSASAAVLDISVKGLQHARGSIMIAVYTTPETYMKTPAAKISASIDPTTLAAHATIDGVPDGTVAVTVYHDENANQNLDTNLVGIPREPVGFSNGARPRFGPPGFDKAAVTAGDGTTAIVINLGGHR